MPGDVPLHHTAGCRSPHIHAAQIFILLKAVLVPFYRRNMLLDRDTIKCFDKDITKYSNK